MIFREPSRGVEIAVVPDPEEACRSARAAGRGGLGALMGSKGLKAVVFAGDRKRPLADPEGAR